MMREPIPLCHRLNGHRDRFAIRSRLGFAAALVAALTLSGCAVGPDFKRPAAPATQAYATPMLPEQTSASVTPGGDAQHFNSGLEIPGQWWMLFHSEQINALVGRALAANTDVKAAEAALVAARETALAGQGAFFPTVQANYAPSRQRNAVGTLAPTLTSGAPVFNLDTAQVSVSYVFDVFGGNRRQLESLEAQEQMQRFEYEAAVLTVTTNVVAAAIQEAALETQVDATNQVIRIEREQVGLVDRAYQLGDVSMADVRTLEAQLAQTEATLPGLRKQLAQQHDLIFALTGSLPGDSAPESFDLAAMTLPADLPLSVPSSLVEQRPDIRAAEAQLHSATAAVGVATANLLPQVSLVGTYGGTATTLSRIFEPGNVFWSLAGSFSQTFFDGGTLLHKRRAAVAAMDQAAAQYRGTVITAFQNVADTLHALQNDADALGANLRAEEASADSLELARTQLRLGAINTLTLLNAQQTYETALINLTQARAARYADTVALFQALGGGWWNRDPADQVAPSVDHAKTS